jgi:hypothetical protein
MSTFSIWEQGGKCSGEELGILIAVHKNPTTMVSNPGYYQCRVFLLGICRGPAIGVGMRAITSLS